MENLNFRGRWNILRGKLKQANANLTDDDLQYQEGREDELIGRIQRRLGQTREQTVSWINSVDQGREGHSGSSRDQDTNRGNQGGSQSGNRGNQNR